MKGINRDDDENQQRAGDGAIKENEEEMNFNFDEHCLRMSTTAATPNVPSRACTGPATQMAEHHLPCGIIYIHLRKIQKNSTVT